MHGRVAVVTDSTACLPAELAEQWGVTVVPMQLRIGERIEQEHRVATEELVEALRRRKPVATAPPDPAAFFWTYQQLGSSGATAVVSVHISSLQSKTYEFARRAAAQASVPVYVIDSGTTGMSLGFAVLAAARVAGAGGDPRRVMDAATRRLQASSELMYVETLEYLHRGGRIGAAAKLVGSALSLKPLLTVREGQVAPLDRVIGTERALRRIVDTAVARAGEHAVDIAVEHFDAHGRAIGLLEQLRKRLPQARDAEITQVSSALGVHLGPGSLGVTISPT